MNQDLKSKNTYETKTYLTLWGMTLKCHIVNYITMLNRFSLRLLLNRFDHLIDESSMDDQLINSNDVLYDFFIFFYFHLFTCHTCSHVHWWNFSSVMYMHRRRIYCLITIILLLIRFFFLIYKLQVLST